jgi:hypothetical protein
VIPEDILGRHCALLLCSSTFVWLQPQYDTGLGFSPSTRVQLQQFGIDAAFVLSGHSLCRWPPPHHKHRGGYLQLAQTWAKFCNCSTVYGQSELCIILP